MPPQSGSSHTYHASHNIHAASHGGFVTHMSDVLMHFVSFTVGRLNPFAYRSHLDTRSYIQHNKHIKYSRKITHLARADAHMLYFCSILTRPCTKNTVQTSNGFQTGFKPMNQCNLQTVQSFKASSQMSLQKTDCSWSLRTCCPRIIGCAFSANETISQYVSELMLHRIPADVCQQVLLFCGL